MNETPQFCAKFHESANRPHLLFGCEKELLVALLLFAVFIIYAFLPTLWGIPIAALVFFLTRLVLRRMAQYDPLFFTLYSEAQHYKQGFWPAKHQPGKPSTPLTTRLLGAFAALVLIALVIRHYVSR